MPKGPIDSVAFARAQAEHGPFLVDAAMRRALIGEQILTENDSLAHLFARDDDIKLSAMLDPVTFFDELGKLGKIGKPLRTAPAVPGAQATSGVRVGIQGNPPQFDDDYAWSWLGTQDNRWQLSFTVRPLPSGGYWITDPVSHLIDGAGLTHRGADTTSGRLDADNRLNFEIDWAHGARGFYVCWRRDRFLDGETHDGAEHSTRFELERTDASGPAPAPAEVPRGTAPTLTVSAVPNTTDNGWNVTTSGWAFAQGAHFVVEGYSTGAGMSGEWNQYARGTTDVLGSYTATFGVSKPLGYSYTFHVLVDGVGVSPEVGFS